MKGLRITPYKTLKLFCISIFVTAVLIVAAFDVIGFLSCHNEWNVITVILINVPQHMLQAPACSESILKKIKVHDVYISY